MLRRYIGSADAGSSSSPAGGAKIGMIEQITINRKHISNKTYISGGPANGTIDFKIITSEFSHLPNNFNSPYFDVVGIGTFISVGTIFTINCDANGDAVFTTILFNGPDDPSSLKIVLQIIAVSSGTIGSPSTATYFNSN